VVIPVFGLRPSAFGFHFAFVVPDARKS
jgi:hypothetical protein